MKSNRQARHILGLDHKISNQRKKIVTEGDKSSVVNNPTGRKRPAEK
ncbi:stationary-phase-induced ribosome-associated protein [Escherichia coli]|nr:stationary-phase-induced ribosome-associated protein [Escherichia coli]